MNDARMKPFEAIGISKPLGEWRMEEIEKATEVAPVDLYDGRSWVGMLRDEMRHFKAVRVSDLPWQSVVVHGMSLGCFESEEAGLAYVRALQQTGPA